MKQILAMALIAAALLLQGCAQTGGPKTAKEKAEAVRVYDELGLGYLRQGKLDLAEEKLKRALEIKGDDPAANHYIAEVYKQQGDMQNADTFFVRAVELNPKNPMVLNNYGAFLCDQSRFKDAEKYFLQAANAPRYKTPELAYENLALCAQRMNNMALAEEYFRKALEINPKLPKSLYQMAQLSYDKKDYFRARAFLERLHSVVPESEESLKLGIAIEQALGAKDIVREYREKLKNRFPDAAPDMSPDTSTK